MLVNWNTQSIGCLNSLCSLLLELNLLRSLFLNIWDIITPLSGTKRIVRENTNSYCLRFNSVTHKHWESGLDLVRVINAHYIGGWVLDSSCCFPDLVSLLPLTTRWTDTLIPWLCWVSSSWTTKSRSCWYASFSTRFLMTIWKFPGIDPKWIV